MASRERPRLKEAFGVYVHWPFCLSKCPYCDFNSHVHDNIDHDAWADAYLKEIEYAGSLTQDRIVETVFFGGGTPSLMKPDTVAAIIDKIRKTWRSGNDVEITLEANPTSVEADKFRAFKEAGINRVSMGIQSLRADDLKFLGRTHDIAQARRAIETAASTFDRFSFDLIYARPDQTAEAWKEELKEALDLAVGHLSLYQLTIEQGTPFYVQYQRGEFRIPDQELAADLYDATQEVLEARGLPAYEVSNHAKPGEESRHNLIYWRYGDYAGIGPGAHGRLTPGDTKVATRAHRAPDIWLKQVTERGNGWHQPEPINRTQRVLEAIMMGLRLQEGVPVSRLKQECNGDPFDVIDTQKLQTLINEGLMEDNKETLRTTPQGLKKLNGVLSYLLRG